MAYTSTFDDPAENPLSEGSKWIIQAGSSAMRKTGGEAFPSAASICTAAYEGIFAAAHYSEITLSAVLNDGTDAGPLTHALSNGYCYGFAFYYATTWKGRLFKLDSGGFAWLGAEFSISTPTAGTKIKLVSNTGGKHLGYVGGAAVGIEQTDTNITTGVAGWYANAASQKITAWEGGNVTSINTVQGLTLASVKTVQGLALSSVKTLQGLP
jgi:hypothetical protein